MKLKPIMIAVTLLLLSTGASADKRVYNDPDTVKFTLADVYNSSNDACLATTRVSGTEIVGNKSSSFREDETITLYNFSSGERMSLDFNTGKLTTDNSLVESELFSENEIQYSTKSTDMVTLVLADSSEGEEQFIHKTWMYTNMKGEDVFGESKNRVKVVDCSDTEKRLIGLSQGGLDE